MCIQHIAFKLHVCLLTHTHIMCVRERERQTERCDCVSGLRLGETLQTWQPPAASAAVDPQVQPLLLSITQICTGGTKCARW